MQTRQSGASASRPQRQRTPHVIDAGLLESLPRGHEAAVEERNAVEPFDESARYQERMDHEGDGYGVRFFT